MKFILLLHISAKRGGGGGGGGGGNSGYIHVLLCEFCSCTMGKNHQEGMCPIITCVFSQQKTYI